MVEEIGSRREEGGAEEREAGKRMKTARKYTVLITGQLKMKEIKMK